MAMDTLNDQPSNYNFQLLTIIICTIFIALLLLYFIPLENKESEDGYQPNYHLKIDGNDTYTAGNLTIVVGNNGNNLSKILNIYGIEDPTSTLMFSSLLATQTGKILENLTFAGSSVYTIRSNGEFPIRIYDVDANDLKSGKYDGFLYIKDGDLVSIPIVLSTEPKTSLAIALVIIGVLLSIIFWELFFIVTEKLKKKGAIEMEALAGQFQRNLERNPAILRPDVQIDMDGLRQRAYRDRITAYKISNRYLLRGPTIVSAEIATVIFGIIIGLIGLASNSYVTNIIEFNEINITILIGIGLGIGSLKGLVDKPPT